MKSKINKKLEAIGESLQGIDSSDTALLESINRGLEIILDQVLTKPLDSPSNMNGSDFQIWSDGACTGNPGPGGWGTIVMADGVMSEFSGGSRKTTNNIMEMTGALEGIKMTPEGSNITLITDSQYLVKGMTLWLKNWKKKGWRKADGKEVLNKELWIELDSEASKRNIEWIWVKGHAGHPENERCDELARKAIKR